ncbi:MAG TPA: methyltransferase domain-containing protein [Bacteroidales bacterium]|nr:methyltransferase domain-containing protein [Bacteroidales bacterium]HPS15967.1 methyltransferase domain-containing protein [Bacteroidales bacterium]
MSKLQYLNLGCGNHFHPDWKNVDFVSNNKNVIAHDLLNGIPFPDNTFDVVYHSHVLEHFPKAKADCFISECFRVLKNGGILRVVVPNLEVIAEEYLKQLKDALNGDERARYNYEWMLLEMYDQTVRNYSGGEMGKYLFQKEIKNIDYVYNRIGIEGKNIRENYLKSLKKTENIKTTISYEKSISKKIMYYFKPLTYFNFLKRKLLAKEWRQIEQEQELLKLAKFRTSGEIHQWMYDRYSLKELLEREKFVNVKIKTAFESEIKDWNSFELDVINNEVRKPDSLFIEAKKINTYA